MRKITLDENLRTRLNGLDQHLELCDEAGSTMGHFLPEAVYQKLLYRLAELQCPTTPEELARQREETDGMSLAEFWKTLGQS